MPALPGLPAAGETGSQSAAQRPHVMQPGSHH